MLLTKPTFISDDYKYQEYISRNFDGTVRQIIIVVIDIAARDTAITLTMEQMVGCNGVAILHKVSVEEPYRMRGYASRFIAYLEAFAASVGWSAILCSVVKNNAPMEAIMSRRGYAVFSDFHNPKTGNHVNLYYKNLKFNNDGKELA